MMPHTYSDCTAERVHREQILSHWPIPAPILGGEGSDSILVKLPAECVIRMNENIESAHASISQSNHEAHQTKTKIRDAGDFYRNKLILSPMVRMNTLAFRLLALDYGADIVYSDEIVDHKLLGCKRQTNEILNTVDYIDPTDGRVVFRTCPQERGRVILQLGSGDPERAAEVAKFVSQDVAGIDINMGCPKHFSLAGGMGAALLSNVSNARKIIESVRNAVNIPVTCKIRVLENAEKTISFCKQMEDSGATAIAVHGRTIKQREHHANQVSVIRNVSRSLSIPVIANGESGNIKTYDDILKFREESGCTSVMIGRAAQWNPSIFRTEGKIHIYYVIRAFLKYAIDYDTWFSIAKFCVHSMISDLQDPPKGIFRDLQHTRNIEDMCKIWNMDEYCRQRLNEHKPQNLQAHGGLSIEFEKEKHKIDEIMKDCDSLPYKFSRFNYHEDELPKNILLAYAHKRHVQPPNYHTLNVDKSFRCIVTFLGRKYTSTLWEKNKKAAEHAAAAVCLTYFGQYDVNELRARKIIL